MTLEIDEFYQEVFQDIVTSADADGQFKEDSFFEYFSSRLVDAGEIETHDRAAYLRPTGGMRVDGYGGDPQTTGGTLSLIISDFNQSPELSNLTATEMDATFKRLSNFLQKSLDGKFRNGLEETSPAFGLADLIAQRWSSISKVRLFLISNRRLSARVDGRAAEELDGRTITYSVWDIDRLHRFETTGHGREEILIDLDGFGGSIPLLPAHLPEAGYEAYLAVMPGSQLAAIYDRWGARLLEQNVRVFLQFRSAVNKGLRNTLEHDAAMFFAYNNGITATAQEIQTKRVDGRLVMKEISNLQIVNGGQTTAAIHAAYRQKMDLSKVFVQMKLSIVEQDRAVEVVPKISEYANSQNKVNAADFFANHPFHVRMEEYSRRLFAPSPDGTFIESKWFYERARGQYADARALLTPAQRKKFDLEYPKRQLFTKTDLAKFLNVWLGYPERVSLGAQKNFGYFAHSIGKEWSKQSDTFNENYFRHAIAKAIVFKTTEKLVSDQEWYQGGYRANIVAYAIAKTAHDADSSKKSIDFDTIWRKQGVSPAMADALVASATAVNEVLVNPPDNMRNVTEWAKKQACWDRVKKIEVEWSDAWLDELIGLDEEKAQKRSAIHEQRVLNGIEAQTYVVNAGAEFWGEVLKWGKTKRLLTPREAGILKTAAEMPKHLPTEAQSKIAVETLKKLHQEGCQLGRN